MFTLHKAAKTAVFNRAQVNCAHAADTICKEVYSGIHPRIAVFELEIFHYTAGANLAEQTGVKTVTLVIQPADGVALAVESTIVRNYLRTNGRGPQAELAAVTVEFEVFRQHILIDGDVRRQLGVSNGVLWHLISNNAAIPIHQTRKPVEIAGVGDLVDAVLQGGRLASTAATESFCIVVVLYELFVALTGIVYDSVRAVEGGRGVLFRALQILPPCIIHLFTIQQPRHLAGGELLRAFLRGVTAAAADAFVAAGVEPVAIYEVLTEIIVSAHTAHIVAAAHSTGVIAVGDAEGIRPAHTAHIAAAAHSTGIIAGRYRVCTVPPAHTAHIAVAAHGTGIEAVNDSVYTCIILAIVSPAHTAYITAGGAVALYGAFKPTAFDIAGALVHPTHTADRNGITRSAHGAGAGAVGDGSEALVITKVIPADTAGIGKGVCFSCGGTDIAVRQLYILDRPAAKAK